jgi:serine/threonine-protein kinase
VQHEEALSGSGALVGRMLCGKWRLEHLLGSGGMSSVYAAVHRNGKRVAIKVLNGELTGNRRVRDRFVREGYIANRVGHEGTVTILDDDADGDLVFLVMELLEGETLSARARRLGGLPVEEVTFAADGVLSVLAAAHASGIVHRDVKPENVFLTRTGQVKLLDFGIAKLREVSVNMSETRHGSALGTPGFMAPEQARGRWTEVDARTDLWAMGATMFRLLTGRTVHVGETANEAMIAAATVPAPSLGELRPELSADLVALVDRALAFEPPARWQSALDMQAHLRQVRAHLPAHVWSPPPEEVRPPGETINEEPSVATATAPTVASPALLTTSVDPSGTAAEHPRRRRRLPRWAPAAGVVAVGAAIALVALAPWSRRSPAPAPPVAAAPPPVSEAPAPPPPPAPVVERPEPAAPEPPRGVSKTASHPHPARRPGHRSAPPPPQVSHEPAPAPEPEPAKASLPPPPLTPPSVPLAPAPTETKGQRIFSTRPLTDIPAPHLPRSYQPQGAQDLARLCELVESETVARARVTPAFARGITAPLQRALRGGAAGSAAPGGEILPVAIYYFIISEAARGHDKETAAQNLLSAHRSKALRKLDTRLPAVAP